MKPLLFSLALLFIGLTAKSQTPYYYYYKNVDDSIPVYMLGDFARYDTAHKATFTVIDSIAFKQYKKAFKPQADTSRKNVTWLDTTFTIKTAKGNFSFQHRQKSELYDITLYYYMGYIKALNLFVITGVDSPNEVSWIYGIDKTSGKWYMIPSADGGDNMPLLSPDSKNLLVWDSDMYEEDGAYIDMYKVTKDKKEISYSIYWSTLSENNSEDHPEYAERDNALWGVLTPEVPDSVRYAEGYVEPPNYEYSSWLLADLVWVSNTTFAFKTNRVYYDAEQEKRLYTPYNYVLVSF